MTVERDTYHQNSFAGADSPTCVSERASQDIDRAREAVRFLLKGDLLALGGLITLVSAFGWDTKEFIDTVSLYHWLPYSIGCLIIVGIVVEGLLTVMRPTGEDRADRIIQSVVTYGYLVFAAAHVGVAAFALGWVTYWIENVGN